MIGNDQNQISAAKLISRISDSLGCSPDVFADPKANDLSQTAEVVRLWHALPTAQDRVRVLEFMRTVAGTPERFDEAAG